MADTEPNHFVITWKDAQADEFVTLKARHIGDSGLGITFVAVSGLMLATESAIVDPKAEALSRRFAQTEALHLPLHAIAAIEEVGPDHEGLKLDRDRSNLLVFPPDSRTEN